MKFYAGPKFLFSNLLISRTCDTNITIPALFRNIDIYSLLILDA